MAGEWVTRRIGSLGRVVTGKTPTTADRFNFGGPYPFITIPDLHGRVLIDRTERTLSEKGAEALRACFLPAGSVMMSCIATVGRCGVTTRPSFTNQQINSVVPDDGTDSRFLYYVFTQLGHKLESAGGGGSVYTNVSKRRFSDIEVEIPEDVNEQRTIAHILGTLDDKIELNRQMNETLESIARVLFKSWFVDFDPVRAKMEGRWKRRESLPGLPAHLYGLFPDRLADSELGEIPAGWEVRWVSDVGSVVCGKTPSTKVPEYYGDDIPFVMIPDMHGNVFAATTQKKLSRAGAASQANKTLPPGAICVSCIATPGLVVVTTEESQTNQQINSVVLREPNQTYYWLWVFRDLGDQIRAGGSGGSVLTNLSTGRFSELHVLASTAELRRWYHSRVAELFERIRVNLRETAAVAALRDTVLPKLISGELRVKDAENFLKERGR